MYDMVKITIIAKTMEGTPVVDSLVTIDVIELNPTNQQIAHVILNDFSGSAVIQIPTPDTFPTWQVTISLSRFDAGSGFVFQPRGKTDPTFQVLAARLPGKWQPAFIPLKQLESLRFDPFRAIVSVSTNVDLKNGPPVGDLSVTYNSLSGTPQILGKTALLNLFAVLTDEQDPIGLVPWFSYVRKIVRMDQERFLAEVDPALFENVQTIINELGSKYTALGYFTEPAADLPLHIPNIPTAYHSDANLIQIITLKKDYRQGNVQLTVSFLRVNGVAVHLLDCDMDENRNIVLHSFDILRHLVNGGTSPISMHEYIVADSALAEANGVATIDLGYKFT